MRASERLLLACLSRSGDGDRAASLQPLVAAGIHWDYLFWLAEVHNVVPLLHWALKDIRLEGVPPAFLARLSEHYNVSALRNRMLFSEFRKFADLLDAHGIDFIALKGITLASTVYEDPALRQFADIDLLLHERDIDKARELFEQEGLRPVYSHGILSEGSAALSGFQNRVYRTYYHQYELNSRDGLIYVDIHWRLSPRVYPADITAELAWRDAIYAEVQGRKVKVLPDELQLLYLCAHGAKDGWCQLKWVVDASRLLEAGTALDWKRLFALARNCRCEKILATGLALAHHLLAAQLPPPALERTLTHPSAIRTARRLGKRLLRSPERGFRIPCIGINHTYLSLLDGPLDQIRHVFRVLTYPQARDCNTLGLSEGLLPVWPWLRPFRIIGHCLRRSLSRSREPAS